MLDKWVAVEPVQIPNEDPVCGFKKLVVGKPVKFSDLNLIKLVASGVHCAEITLPFEFLSLVRFSDLVSSETTKLSKD